MSSRVPGISGVSDGGRDSQRPAIGVVTQTPTMLLCMYDLRRRSVEVLVEVLRLHPRVLVSEVELVNPYYVRPQNYPVTEARQVHDGADRSEGRGQQATDADVGTGSPSQSRELPATS